MTLHAFPEAPFKLNNWTAHGYQCVLDKTPDRMLDIQARPLCSALRVPGLAIYDIEPALPCGLQVTGCAAAWPGNSACDACCLDVPLKLDPISLALGLRSVHVTERDRHPGCAGAQTAANLMTDDLLMRTAQLTPEYRPLVDFHNEYSPTQACQGFRP